MKFFHLFLFALSTIISCQLKASESYLVMEANSNRVLLAKNSEKKRPVDGLAKIAAARVALDWARLSKTSLNTMMIVPDSVFQFPGANPMGLRPGERLSIRDAIYSAMLGADTTAMHTLAHYVGQALLVRRQKQGDPQKVFVREMNILAKSLGMKHTRFVTPSGLHLGRKKTYSTASDIARLCVYAMRDDGFTFYVKQRSRKISVTDLQGRKRFYTVLNTNQLLGKQNVNGIKTALSMDAGQCVALNSHHQPLVTKLGGGRTRVRKRDLIVVLLGSSDRFSQASQLIRQGWLAFDHWGALGYPVSENKKEFLIVPKLYK